MKIIYDFLKPSRDYLTEDYLVDSDNELLYIVKMSDRKSKFGFSFSNFQNGFFYARMGASS